MTEVQFLFNTDLVAGLENLIKNARHKLLLVSPFIDLSNEIKVALNEHVSKHDFELLVLFGKNEDNLYKSIKKDSFEFLKQFPNVDIRYNERLHAKFYQNDFDYIMTSLNLYDYSLAKNIEVGIFASYAAKGLLGKLGDGTNTMLNQGVDKVKHEVLGFGNKNINPIEQFQKIFDSSEKKYKTKPIKVDQSGFKGLIGAQKLNGFKVLYDNLSSASRQSQVKVNYAENIPKETKTIKNEPFLSSSNKPLSTSQLSKILGVSAADITSKMQNSRLINGDKITDLGKSKGLVMKNYMGKDYIAYPESLAELDAFAKLK